jgi:hypothetical protein
MYLIMIIAFRASVAADLSLLAPESPGSKIR